MLREADAVEVENVQVENVQVEVEKGRSSTPPPFGRGEPFRNVFPDDETPRVAVAVEVKVASPFVWSTSGLKSYNNQAQYKVDAAFDGAKDYVAPIHVPQAQLGR